MSIGLGLGIGLTKAASGASLSALYTGQVATRTFIASNNTPAQTQAMCRSHHYARDTITELQLVFQDATGVNEAASGATTTIEATIEYPESTYTRVQFSASDAGSMASGATLVSDAVTVSIPDGAKFWVRAYYQNANGFNYNLYALLNAAAGDASEAGASVTNKVEGGSITSNVAFVRTPQAIIAETRKPSVFLLGDSRVIGVTDDFSDNASGDTGEFARTIGPEYAYINAGIAGDKASNYLSNPTKRTELANYCSHAMTNYGINSVTSSTAEATIKTELLNMWGILRNGKDGIFHSTMPPVTTSTDSWATTGNQTTHANNSVRVNVNNWLRQTPDNLNTYFEVANAVESAEDSGLWQPPYTSDGTHENEAGYLKIVSDEVINTALVTRPAYDAADDEADLLFKQWDTQPDAATETAYRTFIASLVADGIWAKLDILYVLAGPDVQAARVNLIDPKSFRLTRHNSPTFGAYDGFTGNGTNADLSTNWKPSRDAVNYTQNSASIFVWNNDNARSNSVLIGYASGGVKAYLNPHNSSQDTMGHALNDSTLKNAFAPGVSNGLFTLSRESSASYIAYAGATAKGTQSTASTGVPSEPLRIGSGLLYFDGVRTASIMGAGAGLSAAEVSDLNNAVTALMTALTP